MSRRTPYLSVNSGAGLVVSAGAAGRGVAKAGESLVRLGENKLADDAKQEALRLEKKKHKLNDAKFTLEANKHGEELSKQAAKAKAKSVYYAPYVKEFEKQHPLNTADLNESEKIELGNLISEGHKDLDADYKFNKIWRDEKGVDHMMYSNSKGESKIKPLGKGYDWSSKTKAVKKKAPKDDVDRSKYVEMPDGDTWQDDEKWQTKRTFKGNDGHWVLKTEVEQYAVERKKANDVANQKLK